MVIDVKNLSTTYDCKSAETPNVFHCIDGGCHKSHPKRPERAEAPSPGHRPGCSGWRNAPCKGKSFKIRSKFKAFALTGRQVYVYNTQGDALG